MPTKRMRSIATSFTTRRYFLAGNGAEAGIVPCVGVGEHPTFTEALASLAERLHRHSLDALEQGDRSRFRAHVDRLVWLSLGREKPAACGPGLTAFQDAVPVLARRNRPAALARSTADGQPDGLVLLVDASCGCRLLSVPDCGWAYLKDARAQAAALLREIALSASPGTAADAVRSLSSLAAGMLPQHGPETEPLPDGFEPVVRLHPGDCDPVRGAAVVLAAAESAAHRVPSGPQRGC